MRRTVIKTGLFLCACNVFLLARPMQAKALSIFENNDKPAVVAKATPLLDTLHTKEEKPQTKQETTTIEATKPVEHIVQPGESLSSIAITYQTTWKRLYNKNTTIVSPDVIDVSQRLIIPAADEVLLERDVPVVEPVAVPQPVVHTETRTAKPKAAPNPARPTTPAPAPVASSSGNTYVRGYCTWYAKNRRPDLPNNLGNAISWVSRAAAQGLATGSSPRVGAIGQSGNHVVFVESVNGDGTVTVSEMNWKGWGVVSSRTASASSFNYIY